jgi:hypothetical protein
MKQFPRNNSAVKPKRINSAFSSKIQLSQHHYFSPSHSNKNNLDIMNFNKYGIDNESKKQFSSKLTKEQSHFSFKTNLKQINTDKRKQSKNNKRFLSANISNNNYKQKKWRFSDEPVWKKFLRGKLLYLVKKNIVLCEKKFNPTMFTESISNVRIKEFKNKFRNLDNRNKVGIFTNKFPSILNQGNKFYTRYFDYFISPDELLNQNFTKEEIFQIKADPIYFNFGGNFSNVNFFKKRTLKETLNEEEKIGPTKLLDVAMQKSLKQTKKRIQKYLNYYTSVMSRQGLIG